MIKFKKFLMFIVSFVVITNVCANTHNIKLSDVSVNLEDISSIKRGSFIFFEQCQGCHSLKYMRYSDLAAGLNMSGTLSKSSEMLIQEYFLNSTNVISETSPILTSMTKENGVKWFGKIPPDLSLVVRYRSAEWVYSYMLSFYKDTSRPWGVNNIVFPDVGMPHVLSKFQGIQVLKDNLNVEQNFENMFTLIEAGELSSDKYKLLVKDLVTFLSYVSEPNKVVREKIGMYVVIYFLILSVLLYIIKRSYWKDVR